MSNIQGLASRVGFWAPDNGFDVSHLAEYGFCDFLALIEL